MIDKCEPRQYIKRLHRKELFPSRPGVSHERPDLPHLTVAEKARGPVRGSRSESGGAARRRWRGRHFAGAGLGCWALGWLVLSGLCLLAWGLPVCLLARPAITCHACNASMPACLPTCLPACLPACLACSSTSQQRRPDRRPDGRPGGRPLDFHVKLCSSPPSPPSPFLVCPALRRTRVRSTKHRPADGPAQGGWEKRRWGAW